MGAGFHGGFGHTSGGGSNIRANADAMKGTYPLTKEGYFGRKGKNVRVISSSAPSSTALDFYTRLARGGTIEYLANGHGTKTTLSDGTIIVYRPTTSTKGSPAVSIKITNSPTIKSQKIHFILEAE